MRSLSLWSDVRPCLPLWFGLVSQKPWPHAFSNHRVCLWKRRDGAVMKGTRADAMEMRTGPHMWVLYYRRYWTARGVLSLHRGLCRILCLPFASFSDAPPLRAFWKQPHSVCLQSVYAERNLRQALVNTLPVTSHLWDAFHQSELSLIFLAPTDRHLLLWHAHSPVHATHQGITKVPPCTFRFTNSLCTPIPLHLPLCFMFSQIFIRNYFWGSALNLSPNHNGMV